jgi:solute carrier family 25 aspartate/glutamate transporter 12/13
MATLLKFRESQRKAAAMLSTPSDVIPYPSTSTNASSEQLAMLAHGPAVNKFNSATTNDRSVNIARRVTSLEILPRPEKDKRNKIGQQVHTVEMRSGGTIAFRVPLYQKMLVGGVSGVIGLSTVFPIDLIKTRLQISNGGLSSVCRDVMAKHGFGGFYRGLGTTAVMVFPEKACKLGVNDYLRDVFCNYDRNKETIPQQVAAGALTGVVQVAVTNPMEIMKIRLQTAESAAVSPLQAARELGLKGLYTGSCVTLMRDVPYNVIFFLSYIEIKRALTSPDGDVSRSRILGSGIAAGMLAAFCGTPMDVIKSRIQMRNSPYTNGAVDCAKRLYGEGGYGMFFRGALPRMAVQGPLYGIALLCFELQSQYLSS